MHVYIADLNTICNQDDLSDKLSLNDFTRYRSFARKIRAKQFLFSHLIADGFRDEFRYISIAHKDKFVVIAASNSPIGVDIEDISKRRDFISLAEFMGFNNVESLDDFYRLFTLYEAKYKAASNTNLKEHFYKLGDYMICIVSNDSNTTWVNRDLVPEQI